MNRTEIKSRLKDIFKLVDETIDGFNSKNEWLNASLQKIDDLADHLNEHTEDVFEHEELKQAIINELISNELSDVYHVADELRNDIMYYGEDMSETRRERLYEKYEDLEIVIEMLYQDHSQYEDISEVVDQLEEVKHLLKMMY